MTVFPVSSSLHLCLLLFISRVQGIVRETYTLDTSYSGTTFFDDFDFFTDPDPTNGFVAYQSHASSLSKSLISTSNNVAHIGVDCTTALDPDCRDGGRESVRISSKKRFTQGLFLADIKHMPGNVCGAESVINNGNTCTISGANSLGTLQSNDCNQNHGFGCSISSSSSVSYGSSFNAALGGVYATQWTSDYIRIWFFPRASIPADIASGEPDPGTWGTPDANFQGSCDIDREFRDHQIIFDTTFCGDWAGSAWNGDEVCSKKAGSCQEFVASAPEAFADAYWEINYVKVFTLTDAPPPPATTKALPSTKGFPVPVSLSTPKVSTAKVESTQLLATSSSSSTLLPSSLISAKSLPSSKVLSEPVSTSKPISLSKLTVKFENTQLSATSSSLSISPLSSPTSIKALSSSKLLAVPLETTTTTSQYPTTSKYPSTLPPSSPTSSFPPFPSSPHNSTIFPPPKLPNWNYIGCLFSKPASFPTFNLTIQNANMTIPLCASACANSAYLGTLDISCFCGSELAERSTNTSSQCTIPCPGSLAQPCGGYESPAIKKKRFDHRYHEDPSFESEKRDSPNYFLTVYQNEAFAADPVESTSSRGIVMYPTPDSPQVHFVPKMSEVPTSTLIHSRSVVSSASLRPKGTLIGMGMGGGLNTSTSSSSSSSSSARAKAAMNTYTTVVTTTYTDICDCAASTMEIYTITSTLTSTHCGWTATHSPYPSPSHSHSLETPMTTITRICADCGRNGIVIMTIPYTPNLTTSPLSAPPPTTNPIPPPPPSSSKTQTQNSLVPEPEPQLKIATITVFPTPIPSPIPRTIPIASNVNGPGNTSVSGASLGAGGGGGGVAGNTTVPVSSRAENMVVVAAGLRWRRGLCVLFGLAGLVFGGL
ncbi:uncharacterized protein RAG0_06459 [Rhynchosporium agropyri]|uniref:WSC domain-containing protein n=1 Tax=Rhynchosporium agropyri TaxID=914238 RepID=A0A1E1KH05_9HELO|nr:uncharacterized protein RAG0_06459 [Rhynchosporium agropyri]